MTEFQYIQHNEKRTILIGIIGLFILTFFSIMLYYKSPSNLIFSCIIFIISILYVVLIILRNLYRGNLIIRKNEIHLPLSLLRKMIWKQPKIIRSSEIKKIIANRNGFTIIKKQDSFLKRDHIPLIGERITFPTHKSHPIVNELMKYYPVEFNFSNLDNI